MAREKRVVLILVEGPSDENALLEPMQAALDFTANGALPEARALAFHCDVTTVRPFSWEASFAVKDRVRDTVRPDHPHRRPGRRLHTERVHRRGGLRWIRLWPRLYHRPGHR